eukprot:g17886.t1
MLIALFVLLTPALVIGKPEGVVVDHPRVIYVIKGLQRSGTNLLTELLNCHFGDQGLQELQALFEGLWRPRARVANFLAQVPRLPNYIRHNREFQLTGRIDDLTKPRPRHQPLWKHFWIHNETFSPRDLFSTSTWIQDNYPNTVDSMVHVSQQLVYWTAYPWDLDLPPPGEFWYIITVKGPFDWFLAARRLWDSLFQKEFLFPPEVNASNMYSIIHTWTNFYHKWRQLQLKQMTRLDYSRVIFVPYETLLAQPDRIMQEIADRMSLTLEPSSKHGSTSSASCYTNSTLSLIFMSQGQTWESNHRRYLHGRTTIGHGQILASREAIEQLSLVDVQEVYKALGPTGLKLCNLFDESDTCALPTPGATSTSAHQAITGFEATSVITERTGENVKAGWQVRSKTRRASAASSQGIWTGRPLAVGERTTNFGLGIPPARKRIRALEVLAAGVQAVEQRVFPLRALSGQGSRGVAGGPEQRHNRANRRSATAQMLREQGTPVISGRVRISGLATPQRDSAYFNVTGECRLSFDTDSRSQLCGATVGPRCARSVYYSDTEFTYSSLLLDDTVILLYDSSASTSIKTAKSLLLGDVRLL